MDTKELIQSLSDNATPVKRLRSPMARAFSWLFFASVVIAFLTLSQGLRPQFVERMRDTSFVIDMAASVLTGIFATIAAFQLSLPDRSRWWALLPLPTLIVWLSHVGYQCLTGWVALPPGAVTVHAASSCLMTVIFTSFPLAAVMLAMMRYTFLLRPMTAILTGALAVSAMTSAALSMFHPLDATAMILGWNIGVGVLIVGSATWLGRRLDRRAGYRGN
jgi:hypothetical protein